VPLTASLLQQALARRTFFRQSRLVSAVCLVPITGNPFHQSTLKSFVYMEPTAKATIRSTRAQDDDRQRVAREVDILHVCEVFGQPLGPQLLLGRDLLCRFDTYAFGLSLDHLARDIPSKLATEDATPIPADVHLAKEELNSSHLSRLAASPVLERGDPRPPSETNVFVTAMHAEGPSRSERYNKLNDEDNRVALIVQHHKPRHFGSIAIVQSIRAAGYNRINIHQQALAHCQRCEGCIRHTKHHSAAVRHVAIPRPPSPHDDRRAAHLVPYKVADKNQTAPHKSAKTRRGLTGA
jgi:hypothetical protein